jgi:hypothetical protein
MQGVKFVVSGLGVSMGIKPMQDVRSVVSGLYGD